MQTVSEQEIRNAIRTILVPEHNLAMIHSSSGTFGFTDCVDIWKEEADRAGYTIALPTFSWSYCKSRMYHYKNTPAETGLLPELFRRQKNVIRGKNPIFSFAGYGVRAGELIAHPGETCWGKDTPFDYINNHDGLLIMFGVGCEYLTFYHHIEEMKLVPYHYFKTFDGRADYGEGFIDVAPKYHVRSLELPSGSDFSLVHNALEKENKMRIIRLGGGVIRVLKAREVYVLGCQLIERDPYVFLKDKKAYFAALNKSGLA